MLIVFLGLTTAFLCACICLCAMKDLRRNYLKVGLFAGLGVLHGLVPAITPYHLLDPVFSYDSRVFATFYSLSMVIVIIIGWSLYEHFRPHSKVGIVRLLDAISSRQGRTLYKRLFWATAILGILGIVIRVHATGSSILGMAYAMRLAYRFEANPVLNMLGFYLLSFSLAPGFLGFFLSRQYRIWGVVYTLVIAALCFFAISKGTRALPLGLCGSVLFGYFLQKSMDVRRLAGIGCGGLVILWLAISLYEVRHEMSSMSAGEIMGMMFSPDVAADMLTRDPLNYNENLVGAVATFPSQHPFLAGATYRRMLLFLVPRRLCPGLKPEDPNKIFAMEAFNTAVNLETTIPPTIPGDCYINFGAVGGLFALGGYGIFFAWVSEKLRSSVLWFTAIAPQFVKLLLLGMRGQPYELLVMCLFVLFGTWLLGFLVSMPFKGLQQALTPHRRNSRSAVGQPKPFASPTVGKV